MGCREGLAAPRGGDELARGDSAVGSGAPNRQGNGGAARRFPAQPRASSFKKSCARLIGLARVRRPKPCARCMAQPAALGRLGMAAAWAPWTPWRVLPDRPGHSGATATAWVLMVSCHVALECGASHGSHLRSEAATQRDCKRAALIDVKLMETEGARGVLAADVSVWATRPWRRVCRIHIV